MGTEVHPPSVQGPVQDKITSLALGISAGKGLRRPARGAKRRCWGWLAVIARSIITQPAFVSTTSPVASLALGNMGGVGGGTQGKVVV